MPVLPVLEQGRLYVVTELPTMCDTARIPERRIWTVAETGPV